MCHLSSPGSKSKKTKFEPSKLHSFLAKVDQHSIMPSFEELIRVVYSGSIFSVDFNLLFTPLEPQLF